MSNDEFQRAVNEAKNRALARFEQQRQIADATRHSQQKFDLTERRPFENHLAREFGEFIKAQQARPQREVPVQPPPRIEGHTASIGVPSGAARIPVDEPANTAPAQPVPPGMFGTWYPLTLCDGATLDVLARNIVEP